jgi:hypothetical protein
MAQKRKAIDSTVIARVVAPVKQAESAGTADLSWLVLLFFPAGLDGNPSEIQSRFKAATRIFGHRSDIVEYYNLTLPCTALEGKS